MLDSLWSLISVDFVFSPSLYSKFVNDRVRLSLYGDFQYPLATDSTLESFYTEKPEGEYSPELKECRTQLWSVLRGYPLKLLRLAPAKFIHFGTTKEILELMTGGVENYSGKRQTLADSTKIYQASYRLTIYQKHWRFQS